MLVFAGQQRVQRTAKLNFPYLPNAIRRDRLITLLDQAQAKRVTWVCGVPGAGKTTAVADYIAARKRRSTWINIDEEDKDPAAFFHYFGQALTNALPKHKLNFPLLESDYQANPLVYARLFFRYVTQRIRTPIVVVLDNLQEANSEILHRLLEIAVQETSHFLHLILISREFPPLEFSRLYANQQLFLIEPQHLRFSIEEATRLFDNDHQTSIAAIESLQKQTEGWAAGLILLRESPQRSTVSLSEAINSQEILFNYFAQEVFVQASPELKEFLLRTTFLPYIPISVARALNKEIQVDVLLNHLLKRNLFTYKVQKDPLIVRYHLLFRDFLLTQAHQHFSQEVITDLRRQSAYLLQQCGHIEEAVNAFLDAGVDDEAAKLVLELAPQLCREGRYRALVAWLDKFPDSQYQKNPWLYYWLGEAKLSVDELAARSYFERAYLGFVNQQDSFGQLMTAATLLEAMQWGEATYRGVDQWAAVVIAKYHDRPSKLNAGDELRIVTGRLLADLLLGRHSAELQLIALRMQALLFEEIDVNRRVRAAIVLLGYYIVVRERQQAHVLAAAVEGLLTSNLLAVGNRATWLTVWGYYLAFTDNNRIKAIRSLKLAEQIANDAQLPRSLLESHLYQAELSLAAEDHSSAAALLGRCTKEAETVSGLYRIGYYHTLAKIALFEDRIQDATDYARLALQHCNEIELPPILRQIYEMTSLYVSAIREHCEEAKKLIDTIEASSYIKPTVQCLLACVKSYLAYSVGNSHEATQSLQEALTRARELNYPVLSRLPNQLSRSLYRLALEKNIEIVFLKKQLANERCITPEPDWSEWPWQVKIHLLGQFAVLVDGRSLFDKRKTSPKTLSLLRVLAILGPQPVTSDTLIELLWPGQGRRGIRNAMDSAVHRMRKLLGNDEAVVCKDNQLSLNRQMIWVDVWAINASIDGLYDARKNKTPNQFQFEAVAERLFELYIDHLYLHDFQNSRLVTIRENLWGKVKQFLLRLAHMRETSGQEESAEQIYLFGLRHDPSAVEFSYALLSNLLRNNRQAEALNVYATHASVMRNLLGREPNAEIQALISKLDIA